jgi:hypothetical protein
VSRAGYYRSLLEQHPEEEDMGTRAAIQEIALRHRRRYAYRRIAAELRAARDKGQSQADSPADAGR